MLRTYEAGDGEADPREPVVLAADDPACLYGVGLPWPPVARADAEGAEEHEARPTRRAGSLVVVLGGVPALGVEGTAAANVAARVVGLGLAAFMLLRHTDVRPSPRLLRPFPKKTLKNMLAWASPRRASR